MESDSEDDKRKNNSKKKNTGHEIVLERAVDRVPERSIATTSSAASTARSAAVSDTVAPTDAAVASGAGLSTSRSGISATGTATDTSVGGPPSVPMTPSESRKTNSNDANVNTENKRLGSRRSSVNDDASFKSTASLYSRASAASSRRSTSSLKNSSQASYTRSRRDSEESIYQEAQEISQSLNAKREQRESQQQANRVTWVDNSDGSATTLQPIQSVPVTADVSAAHSPNIVSRVGSRPSSGTHASSHDRDALLKRGSMLLDGDDGELGVHHQHTPHEENDHQDRGHDRHHHHHNHRGHDHPAINVPSYRKPSEGLMKFKVCIRQ